MIFEYMHAVLVLLLLLLLLCVHGVPAGTQHMHTYRNPHTPPPPTHVGAGAGLSHCSHTDKARRPLQRHEVAPASHCTPDAVGQVRTGLQRA